MNETSDSSTTKVDLAISKAKSDESLMHIVIDITMVRTKKGEK